MPLKINNIHVENFLSFRSMDITFEDLTVLVGPNASGKSNITKIFRFLQAISSSYDNIVSVIQREFGYKDYRNLFYNNLGPIVITVDFDYGKKPFIYVLRFNIKCEIELETLMCNEDIIFRMEKENNEGILYYDNGKHKTSVNFQYSVLGSHYSSLPEIVDEVREDFIKITSYSFDPDRIRSIYPIKYNEKLMYTGENLVQVLHTLLTNKRKQFNKIESLLRDVIPQIEEINTPPEKNSSSPQARINLKEKNLDKMIDYTNISDGTLRLLAFITALNLDSEIITFEEPENFIHPKLFQTLIDMFKKSDKQIILTTHSPYLVNQVKIEQLRLLSRKDNESLVNVPDNFEQAKNMLREGFFLGELWYTGRLDEKDSEA